MPKFNFLMLFYNKCRYLFYLFSILIITACSTYGLGLQSFFVEYGVMQYYIPQAKLKGKNAFAISDFTFRQSNSSSVAICNLTFNFKKFSPKIVNAIIFIADGEEYRIKEILPMFREHSAKMVRVSMYINEEYFVKLLSSKSLKLFATIDGMEYEFFPSKAFMRNKNELYENLL